MGSLTFDVQMNHRALALLEQLPLAVQGRVGAKAVTAGVREVRRVLRAKIPDSRKTGTRKLWSKKTAKRYENYKPMRQSIKVYNRFRKGEVGAKLWVPGLAWLEYGFWNRLWGSSGKHIKRMKANPIFRKSVDSTKRAQQSAIVRVLVRELRKLEGRAK